MSGGALWLGSVGVGQHFRSLRQSLSFVCLLKIFGLWKYLIHINFVSSPPAAILFECVQTIYTIHPKSELLEKAAKCIGKFVLSPKINLKYLGKDA